LSSARIITLLPVLLLSLRTAVYLCAPPARWINKRHQHAPACALAPPALHCCCDGFI